MCHHHPLGARTSAAVPFGSIVPRHGRIPSKSDAKPGYATHEPRSIVVLALPIVRIVVCLDVQHFCIHIMVEVCWNRNVAVRADGRTLSPWSALVSEQVRLDLCLGAVAGEGRWTGELAGGRDRRDLGGGGWRCNDILPLNVFIFLFGFMFDLDVFVEVRKTATEGAGEGRVVLLEEGAYTFVVEGV